MYPELINHIACKYQDGFMNWNMYEAGNLVFVDEHNFSIPDRYHQVDEWNILQSISKQSNFVIMLLDIPGLKITWNLEGFMVRWNYCRINFRAGCCWKLSHWPSWRQLNFQYHSLSRLTRKITGFSPSWSSLPLSEYIPGALEPNILKWIEHICASWVLIMLYIWFCHKTHYLTEHMYSQLFVWLRTDEIAH